MDNLLLTMIWVAAPAQTNGSSVLDSIEEKLTLATKLNKKTCFETLLCGLSASGSLPFMDFQKRDIEVRIWYAHLLSFLELYFSWICLITETFWTVRRYILRDGGFTVCRLPLLVLKLQTNHMVSIQHVLPIFHICGFILCDSSANWKYFPLSFKDLNLFVLKTDALHSQSKI